MYDRYLSYFQGPLLPASEHRDLCADQKLLRSAVPENRFVRIALTATLSTADSMLGVDRVLIFACCSD